MRILVVEDEADLRRQLADALTHAGYAVDLAADGEDGHFLGDTEPYDAAVIGMGTGMTLHYLLSDPLLETVDLIEIEPETPRYVARPSGPSVIKVMLLAVMGSTS